MTVLQYSTVEPQVLIDGKLYTKRLLEDIEIERSLQNGFYGFLSQTTYRARLANIDRELNGLFGGTDQRGALATAKRWDAVAGGAATLLATGRISSYELGDEVGIEVASELPEVLLTLIPKQTITVQVFPKAIDLGFAIPVIFGNAKKVPLAYIFTDLAANVYIYLVSYAGVTPTFVYRQGVLVNASEYTVYNGTYNNSVGGVGGNLTAYCVIVFTKEQMDFQGRLYDRTEDNRITADVTGLQPERNFGRAIRSTLSNATWGLGQPVDTPSFDTTEADLTAIGNLFCDGAMVDQKPAKEYLDELAGVRGIRFDQTEAGAWTSAIDKAATSYAASFGFNDQPGYRNLLQKPVRNWRSTSDAVSTLEMEYRLDHQSGQFRQVTSARTVASRGQPKRIPLSFVRDHTTADKWADYHSKRLKQIGHFIPTTLGLEGIHLLLGDRIVIVAPDYGVNGGFEIERQRIRLTTMDVDLIPYEPDIYTYTAGTLPNDEAPDSGADLSRTAPVAPSNLAVTGTGTEQSSDGTTLAFFDLSWTASTTSGVTYFVQVRKVGETTFATSDETTGLTARVRGLTPGLSYDFQVIARSPQQLFSAATQKLNQTAPGDTTAPSAPSAISVIQGTGKDVQISLTFTAPVDWGTVELYRNTTNDSGTASLIDTKKAKVFHDNNVAYGQIYYYWAKVVDLTGNKSGFSPSSGHSITPVQVVTGDVTDNAITADGLYSNDAQINLSYGIETEIGTLTISTNGGTVLLIAKTSFFMSTGTNFWASIILRIRKDSISGAILDDSPFHGDTANQPGEFEGGGVVQSIDSSQASIQTYKFTALREGMSIGTFAGVLNRRFAALHRKK